MLRKSLGIIIGVAVVTVILWYAGSHRAQTETSSSVALTGQVSSGEEGPMEGVLVSAKRAGSTVTITVVSDAQGRYSFPRNRLEPGRYNLAIRAVGYDLAGPGTAETSPGETSQADLKLRPTQDLASQLTNAEWILSMPGTEEQKRVFLGCTGCHTLEPVVRSHHNGPEFAQVIRRMGTYAQGSARFYAQGGLRTRIQMRPSPEEPSRAQQERMAKEAEYLSTINLSSVSKWEYPLKTLPRPKGKATRVILTEYDLPRPDAQPHDAVVDSEGMVWYSDFGQQFLGKLDPRTGKAVEYPTPVLKPGFPTGANGVELDQEENLWLGMMWQGGIAKFDKKTREFQTWSPPDYKEDNEARLPFTMARYYRNDVIWVAGNNEYRVDLKSAEWKAIDYTRGLPKDFPADIQLSVYGIAVDSENNYYGMNMAGEYIIRVDKKTMNVTPFRTPTRNSNPRRGQMDSEGRLWFAEHRGNKIGMFDTKTEQFQEWAVPTPWNGPYDAMLDKNGDAWTGGMFNDRVVRLKTKTGEMTEYLLPRSTNIRRVAVDNSTNPATFWVGNNHGASLIKLEPTE